MQKSISHHIIHLNVPLKTAYFSSSPLLHQIYNLRILLELCIIYIIELIVFVIFSKVLCGADIIKHITQIKHKNITK
jgi:hypothetical protein